MLRFALAMWLPLVVIQTAAADDQAIRQRMDVNQDGLIDDVELTRRLIFVFARMDQNRDKVVTRQEYADWPRLAAANGEPVVAATEQQRASRFARLDRNGDGMLTFDEYKAVPMAQLQRADQLRRTLGEP